MAAASIRNHQIRAAAAAEGVFMMGLHASKIKAKASNYAAPELRCMNCGRIIVDPMPGLYGRRFCSVDCKDDYVANGPAQP